jgi:lambda family phage portal protein
MSKAKAKSRFSLGRAIDRVVLEIAPVRGARRIAARRALESAEARRFRMESTWEAAETDRLRGGRWLASKLGIDAALEENLETLRDRSRDEVFKDPIASGVIDSAVTNIVGQEICPQARIQETPGLISEAEARQFNDELENLYRRWAPFAGIDGSSFGEIQQLIVRTWLVDGDCFPLLRGKGGADKPIALSIQIIDSARVETPGGAIKDNVRLGIARDSDGKPTGYYVRLGTPGELDDKYVHKLMPAGAVCHLFQRMRPGQSRGIPWLTPVLTTLKDIKDYREAELIGRQVASCYSVFVTTPSDAAGAALLGSTGDYAGSNPDKRVQEVEPGRIDYLEPGQDIKFAQPSRDQSFGEFIEGMLHSVAAGINFPFELLVKDYSKTTYSSGRLSLIDGRLSFKARQRVLADRFLKPVWRELVRQAIAVGECSIDPVKFRADPEPFLQHAWIPPGWPWIDPEKEIAASRAAIDANLSTLSDELAAIGRDTETTLRQKRRDLDLLEELQIPQMAVPGSPQAAPQPGADEPPAPAAAKKRKARA